VAGHRSGANACTTDFAIDVERDRPTIALQNVMPLGPDGGELMGCAICKRSVPTGCSSTFSLQPMGPRSTEADPLWGRFPDYRARAAAFGAPWLDFHRANR
jgi:hypothetical protein